MPRDLRYTPKLPGEIDDLAKVTNDDLVHAQETATQLATPKLDELLAATEDDEVRE
jgi:hypothetical protein